VATPNAVPIDRYLRLPGSAKGSRSPSGDVVVLQQSAFGLTAMRCRFSHSLKRRALAGQRLFRRAILDSASRLQSRAALAAGVAELEADEDDRREMLEVAAFMESMRAAG